MTDAHWSYWWVKSGATGG